MPDITGTFKQVRTLFQQAGEPEVLPFIEGTGFLLLLLHLLGREGRDESWKRTNLGYFDQERNCYVGPENSLENTRAAIAEWFYAVDDSGQRENVPLPPVRLEEEQLEKALMLLYRLEEPRGDTFNQYLLAPPHLDSLLPGKRYPTPRHIVEHMTRLLSPEAGGCITDLACGSGSFLVAAHQVAGALRAVTGFEISGPWTRLAWTNAILHDIPPERLRLYARNSFRGETQADERDLYDGVLMNPPFGIREDPALLARALGDDWRTTSSEVALTALALRRLRVGGRAIVLVPSGVLFRDSTAERELRRQLVEEQTLRAVITYPEDAFQPFSGIQTHSLLFRKSAPLADHPIWLFFITRDGRLGAKNRHDDEYEPNQLPLVEAVVLGQGNSITAPTGESAIHLTWIPRVQDAVGQPSEGYHVQVDASHALKSLVTLRHPAGGHLAHWLTIQQSITDTDGSPPPLDHLVIVRENAEAEPTAWWPSGEPSTSVTWIVEDDAAWPESYWTVKLDDKGDEKKSWWRLYPPDDNTGWRLTENRDNTGALVILDNPPDVPDHRVLLFDEHGAVIATKAASNRGELERNTKDALAVYGADSTLVGYLWDLDELVGEGDAAEHQPRGFLLLLTQPEASFPIVSQSATQVRADVVRSFFAELRQVSSGDGETLRGALLGEIGSEGQVQRVQFWFADQPPWRSRHQQVRGLCLDATGQILGLLLPAVSLQTGDASAYDLQPRSHLPVSGVADTAERDPARLLTRIRKNQHRLHRHLDFMLGIIEQSASTSVEMPPQLANVDLPSELLDEQQRSLWRQIQEDSQADDHTLFTANTFIPTIGANSQHQTTIEQNLELFVALGVIVPVWVQDALYYRRITESDIWPAEGKA
ncbi:MAG TPA: hypothetical protein DEP84_11355 [Chloroflexi bacterium]|nr:hypothetical protein [Chloroflexota bacterium]